MAKITVVQLQVGEVENLAVQAQSETPLAVVVERIEPEEQRAVGRVVVTGHRGGPVHGLVAHRPPHPQAVRLRQPHHAAEAVLPGVAAARVPHLGAQHHAGDLPPRAADPHVRPVHAVEVQQRGVGRQLERGTHALFQASLDARRLGHDRVDVRPCGALRRREPNGVGAGPASAVDPVGVVVHQDAQLPRVGRPVSLIEPEVVEGGDLLERHVLGEAGDRDRDEQVPGEADVVRQPATVAHVPQVLLVPQVLQHVDAHGLVRPDVDVQHVVGRVDDVDDADEQG